MGYNVGDRATLTLAVTPSDGTTAATVSVRAPDGTVSSPAVTGGPASWQSVVVLSQAGVYVATWTVTGLGAQVEQQRVAVAPNGPVATGYATTTQLADWLQAAPPEDADRLLARATRTIDGRVVAWYAVDALGVATEPKIVEALRDAVCAQVEQWLSVGEDNEVDGYPGGTSVGAGGVGLSQRPLRLAPRARQILRDAGLLSGRAW